ncbi:putative transmembrane protein [Rhodopirellula islandica]|uniref:Transmembrane protein n=1 Tax=Rhodopirellula islandica TaxID=595434 RepID=A0A0J1BEJ6_RHOIS|nr:PSD1 and planctomycete cytochrome C domain-containing protein [Rhodopirellula islandica]KLU04950.1 putative transmembrane protein [Rhodopirellula islandica]
MSSRERIDQLLAAHSANELTAEEANELREILMSDSKALDHYLDLCELDEALVSQTAAGTPALNKPFAASPITSQHSSMRPFLTWCAAASALVVGNMIWLQTWTASNHSPVAMVNETVTSSPEVDRTTTRTTNPVDAKHSANRRPPNPWKVINSSGSMNHPALTAVSIPELESATDRKLQFNRDIRPILSETCFHCHGPDEQGRRADLRLDTLEGATADLGGYQPIVPGNLDESEAWKRIISDDPDMLMPPPESHLALTQEQTTLLQRWIEEGAAYEGHWAFLPPTMPEVPTVDFTEEESTQSWARNEIDFFVAARLAESGLAPSPEAEARALIRRLSFDLTGLPPTPDEVNAFVRDYQRHGETAYQETITRLLSSPHHGERMALPWLDQARYADTNGYSIDGGRHMWLWRDWVIQAYNDNMPFDQFLTEQLAGDLLPDPTESQRIATGFNRNHMITHEGGTIPEENLTNYVADRVKTTSEVFLGLTMGCAQCHDHKYDPISQHEYYQFFAFFNELQDRGLDGDGGRNAAPSITAKTVLRTDELPSLEAELKQLREQLNQSTEGLESWLASQRQAEASRGDQFALVPMELLDVSSPNHRGAIEFDADGTVKLGQPSGGLNGMSHSLRLSTGDIADGSPIMGIRISFLPQPGPVKPASEQDKNANAQTNSDPLMVLTPFPDAVPKVATVLVSATEQPADQVDYHRQLAFQKITASSQAEGHATGSIRDESNERWWQPAEGHSEQHLTLTFDQPVDPKATPFLSVLVVFGQRNSTPFEWQIQPFTGNDTDSRWDASLAQVIQTSPSDWDEPTRHRVLETFREFSDPLQPLRIRISNLEERREALTGTFSTMVMDTAAKPRETFVLDRGQYDSPTDRVFPTTPKVLPELSLKKADRLDLARWLTNPKHPLTSRVAVNRIWSLFFGTGLVATSADFGSQGEYPSHPELLDYLATSFVENDWNQQQLMREIVSSATYRQQSSATPEQIELDPKNRLLARGPRFRLPAEFIRDQALAVSDLLVPRVGGPSLQPYQPPALWKEVSHFGSTPATKQVFVQDHGEKLYRRSLYTFVKRTSPHPAMAAFDAPSRELCTMDRGVTNTPIQALVTLNDPQFAEAARVLAARWLVESGTEEPGRSEPTITDAERMDQAFTMVVGRMPHEEEREAVLSLLETERERFAQSPEDALAAVSVGESPRSETLEPAEHAAWMQVATLLLNLSETLTRL